MEALVQAALSNLAQRLLACHIWATRAGPAMVRRVQEDRSVSC